MPKFDTIISRFRRICSVVPAFCINKRQYFTFERSDSSKHFRSFEGLFRFLIHTNGLCRKWRQSPLSFRTDVIKSVAHGYDLSLPSCKHLPIYLLSCAHVSRALRLSSMSSSTLMTSISDTGCFRPCRYQWNRTTTVARRLFQTPEIHQYLIFYAAACVSRQSNACPVYMLKSLDQSDRPDGNQVILLAGLGVVFLIMGDKAQITFNQDISCFHIALHKKLYVFCSSAADNGFSGKTRAFGHPQQEKRAH